MPCLIAAQNGVQVGELCKEPSGALRFQYYSSWLAHAGRRPLSLSLPLSTEPYQGEVVLNFFDNLLPDSDAIKSRLQATFKVPSSHPFDLLAAIGRDCIGAITLYPKRESIPNIKTLHAVPLTNAEVEGKLENVQEQPLGLTGEDEFRISLAGAQEKLALLWHQNQWQQPLGSTATSHIFKLPIGVLPYKNIDLRESCENEWLCLQIINAYGLPTAKADIQLFGAQKALVVERFDRRWSADKSWLMRLPQEDFCQALGCSPALKYENEGGPNIEQCMQLLLGSANATEDRDNFFKAQIIFWLLAAIDGHAKNFSIFLLVNGAYRLTPFYDVISAYPLMAKNLAKERIKMAISVKGKNRHYHWDKINTRHFISTGERCGMRKAKTQHLLQEIKEQTPQVIAAMRALMPPHFPLHIRDAILNGLQDKSKQIEV